MTELSVIIVTLSDRDDIECLENIEADDYEEYEVIISREEETSAAHNDGIRQASPDKLVFLDDDARPQPGVFRTR
jgi:glycosyltransferase involved in cell wall biosynthesis